MANQRDGTWGEPCGCEDRCSDSLTIALKTMGGKFITSFTELVGGEKDPRNLMIVFSIVRVILVEFDIVLHIEVSNRYLSISLS